MSSSVVLNMAPKADPGCCASLYNSSATAVNKSVAWVKTNSKTFAASAGQTLKNVWAAVSAFFTMIAQKLGAFFTAAKDALFAGYAKAKASFDTVPKEGKIALVVGLVATAIATALCCKCSSKEEKTTTETTTAAAATAADTATAATAGAATQTQKV